VRRRLDTFRTVPYSFSMKRPLSRIPSKGAEEARSQLPDLLEAAENGRSTVITRHGRPVAALVPLRAYHAAASQLSLCPLRGSGRGLWGKESARTIRELRDEWSR
jgi:prevent-host-death family protein